MTLSCKRLTTELSGSTGHQPFLCLLYSAASATCCNDTYIIQMVISINQEMALMSCEVLSHADSESYFCYVIIIIIMIIIIKIF